MLALASALVFAASNDWISGEPTSAGDLDFTLTEALQRGDRDAFETIVRRYHDALYRFIWLQLRDSLDTEDVLQDVFANLWDHRTRLTLHTSVRGYLYRAARNRIIDWRKHHRVRERAQDRVEADVQDRMQNTPRPDIGAELEELRRALVQAIGELPERTREVYLLCHQSGLKHAEVAELVGISVKGVEFHLGKALKQLRQALERFAP